MDLWLRVPVPIGPDIGAPSATRLTDEQRLQIREPNLVRPSISADPYRVRAPVVGAITKSPRTPDDRISPRVIFCWPVGGVGSRMAAIKALRAAVGNRLIGLGPFQFLSVRKKSGTSSGPSLSGKSVIGSGILYDLRSSCAHFRAWE